MGLQLTPIQIALEQRHRLPLFSGRNENYPSWFQRINNAKDLCPVMAQYRWKRKMRLQNAVVLMDHGSSH